MFNFQDDSSMKNEVDDVNEKHIEIIEKLQEISNQCYHATKRIKALEDFCYATFSTDGDLTIQQQKRENLIKSYSKFLTNQKWSKLSNENADLLARFEVLRFDDEAIREKIDERLKREEEDAIREKYYNSSILESSIDSYHTTGDTKTGEWYISPYYLFAPVYSLLKEGSYGDKYKEGDVLHIDWHMDRDYRSFIHNRGVARGLEKLGILTRVSTGTKSSTGNPYYTLNLTDLDRIAEIIYKGAERHTDAYLDDKVIENAIFRIDY